MGGISNGRHRNWSAKSTVADYRRIDVRRWIRDCFLKPVEHLSWHWSIKDEMVTISMKELNSAVSGSFLSPQAKEIRRVTCWGWLVS